MFKKNLLVICVAMAVGACAPSVGIEDEENVAEVEQRVIQNYFKIDTSTRQIVDGIVCDDGPTIDVVRAMNPGYEYVLQGTVFGACPDVDLWYYYDPERDPACQETPFE